VLVNALGKALVAAAVVWVCGFGGLLVFFLALPRVDALPGLFDFASATWGDGLALPIMAGSLVYAIARLSVVRREHVVASVMGSLGVLLGAGTQVQWLLDDAPQGNWTFPRAHHFNAAGWYHAGFLTVMSAVTAVLWTLPLLRLARRPVGGSGARASAAVAVGVAFVAAASFAVLLGIDAAPKQATASSVATAVATTAGGVVLAIALVVTVVCAVRGRSPSRGSTSATRR
jgi:hypothetical protein